MIFCPFRCYCSKAVFVRRSFVNDSLVFWSYLTAMATEEVADTIDDFLGDGPSTTLPGQSSSREPAQVDSYNSNRGLELYGETKC